MNTQTLKNLGLTDGEISTYLVLLENGRLPITDISKKTKLNRTGLYDIIENLIRKGLVSYVHEDRKKFFKAAPPSRLQEYLEEKQQELSAEQNKLNILISELEKIHPLNEEKLKVEIFRGKKGLISILEDVFLECKKDEEVLAFGFGGSNFIKVLGPYYKHYINKHVLEEKIRFRAIFDEPEEKEKEVKKLGKIPLTRAKFIFKNYQTPTHTRIYGNKVAIILVEKEPTAILIDDASVAQGFRYFFEFLWNTTK